MQTREKLKIILKEWAERETFRMYQRNFDPSLLKGDEIVSIIGARRSGKTCLCYQIIQELGKTLPKDNIAYINLEDERLSPFRGDELTLLWEVYQELFSPDLNKKMYFFVDEIQNAKNWSKWARRIAEQNKNLKLIITGSSSKLLSKEIATELRGRTLSATIYPLSFSEYLKAKNVSYKIQDILYSRQRIPVKKEFNNYLTLGGFPATIEAGKPKELLNEYYKVMFYRDLADRYKIKNVKLLEDYLNLTIDQTSCHCSISSTAAKLSEFGYSLSKNTLSNFSRYAQDIFLIFEVKRYSYKLKEQLRFPKKIYAIDHGLVQAIRFSFSEDRGRLLENIVFLNLKRQQDGIYYHKNSKECDFLTVKNGKVTQAIQVAQDLGSSKTRKREMEGLLEALGQYQLRNGLILTEDEYETVKVANKTIRILPIWFWLLSSGTGDPGIRSVGNIRAF
ncbi:ATP-binding protein [Elusimicrobiota bacterium]